MLPLVGNDSYAGPFYFYLVAGLLRLGLVDPMVGRMVVMVTGTLTVPATYFWVSHLGQSNIAGLIAAFLIAINPDMILVNSHVGGVTLLLPFFTTLFLLFLTLAVLRDGVGWLLAAGVTAGLAFQSNLVGVLIVGGSFPWLLWQSRSQATIGKWWPLWPAAAVAVMLLVFSPVIIYNLVTDFDTVDVLQEKSYLWQDEPTVVTTLSNIGRLSMQTVRQTSGVLTGYEQFSDLIGVPLLYLALMLASLVYTTRAVSLLPLSILGPFWLVFPVISPHYGFITVGRFTAPLIPVWAAMLGFLFVAVVGRVRQVDTAGGRWHTAVVLVISLVLAAYPVGSLWQYYALINDSNSSGRPLLEISRYAVEQNRGERVYISSIEELSFLTGLPYVPQAAFLMAGIHHEFLPPAQIVGRLFEHPEPAFLILSDRDAALVGQTAVLERVDISANKAAARRHYGLYHLDSSVPLSKPDFVLAAGDLPDGLGPAIPVGEGVLLLGCDMPETAVIGQQLSFNCYWQAGQAMPPAMYVSFVHLINAGATLVAQDDHILGQESYPLTAWQPDEIIRENYTLALPAHLEPGEYQLWLGIYRWPELERLAVPGNPDNVVILPVIHLIDQ
jgi:4-amino-4-deoxy-L-arabinose transferase-like glycosyltransferase